eukprot:g3159.t1
MTSVRHRKISEEIIGEETVRASPLLGKNTSYWFGRGASSRDDIVRAGPPPLERAASAEDSRDRDKIVVCSKDSECALTRRQGNVGRRLIADALDGGHFPYEKMSTSWSAKSPKEKFKGSYVATEKIHGANFSFVTDGKKICVASRTKILSASDSTDFFGCFRTGLVARTEPRALAAFREVQKLYGQDNVRVIWIFGELFGGFYPGEETQSGARLVQHGVLYSPRLEFCAFDVAFSADPDGTGTRTYLPFTQMRSICTQLNIFTVRPLIRGTLQDCLSYPISFDSTIPKLLGYSPLPKGLTKNRAEGIVIRAASALERVKINRGKTQKLRGMRHMLKRKDPTFDERARGSASAAFERLGLNTGSKGSKSQATGKASAAEVAWYEVSSRITTSRIDSAVSKVGPHPKVPDLTRSGRTRAKLRRKLWKRSVERWMDEVFVFVKEDLDEEVGRDLHALSTRERESIIERARTAAFKLLEERVGM